MKIGCKVTRFSELLEQKECMTASSQGIDKEAICSRLDVPIKRYYYRDILDTTSC